MKIRRPRFAAFETAAFLLCLALCLGASSLPSFAAGSCISPPSGLVGWWPGDTNNNDIAGNNNPSGSTGVTLVPAEVSNGFSLGKNGYLEVPPSKSLANQNFTWAAWVKPLGPGPNNDNDGSALLIQDIDNNDISVGLYWAATNNKFTFIFGGLGSDQFSSTDAFPAGSFYHVAGTYDGSVFRLYVNGVAEGSMTEKKTIGYSTNPWSIGSSGQIGIAVNFPRTLNGVIDEVQAFNRALTQSELQAIYTAGSAGECKAGFAQPPPTTSQTGAVVNAASYANPALPNSAIAQGSIFTFFGSGIGPANSPSLAFPLAANLGGVTISVYQGDSSVPAIPIFVSPTQVNAIMPSTAPVGQDTIVLSYQGQPIASAPATVVAKSFGIFSLNSSGSGQGIITNSAYSVIGYNTSAHPGDTLIIWGTGLGAISGSDANAPSSGNVGTTPPPVFVGGTQVTPTYYGRSGCCSGLDQVVFQIPQSVTGCNVPVAVQTGSTTSNFVSLSVAPSGSSTCADPSGLPTSALTAAAANGSAAVGSIIYQTYNDTSPSFNLFGNGGSQTSTGTQEIATFFKDQFTNASAIAPVLNAGACTVYTFTGTSFAGPGILSATGLDAGSSLTVTDSGSQGKMSGSSNIGTYSAPYILPSGTATFTGPGGADVGSFSVSLPVVSSNLKWTNESSIGGVTRSSGVQVNWSGADPNGTVQITGFSIGGATTQTAAGAGFTCTAPGSANTFTVPASVLQSLPASSNFNGAILSVATGSLGISSNGTPVPFSASGLDIAIALTQTSIVNSTVPYQ